MADVALGKKFLGQPVERVEDEILLMGKAQYSDHLPTRAGTQHAAILRSPHAHAKINSIDTTRAENIPGVTAVMTGDDVKEMSEAFLIVLRQPINQWALAVAKVRYVGEPVAIVVARNRYIAEDALAEIDVTYEAMKPTVDQEEAILDDAPIVHEAVGSNVVSTRDFTYGDPDDAFAVGDSLPPGTILLIDDVMTTGSTLNAAARTLKASGAERVSAWVLCRSVIGKDSRDLIQ